MKNKFLFSLILVAFFANLKAQNFYWVNNGGSWSDYENHWATSSGGSVMHDRAPGEGDNVYFDENSFTESSQLVSLNSDVIACAVLNMENVSHLPEFYGSTDQTLRISENLILAEKSALRFNLLGDLVFSETNGGQIINFDPKDHEIIADITIDITGGTLNVLGNLNLKKKNLLVYDGDLNLNGHNIYIRHFNTDPDDPSLSASVLNPELSHIDTLFCNGSFHLDNNTDISEFSAVMEMNARTLQDNYLYTGNHNLNSDINFRGNKAYYLLSSLSTTKDIVFSMSGEFYTQNNNINAFLLQSTNSLSRTIDLGTSLVSVSEFSINTTGLNLASANADLAISGSGECYFYTDRNDLNFNTLNLDTPGSLYWDGKIICQTIDISPGSKVNFKEASVWEFDNLSAQGDCGNYIELRAACTNSSEDEPCVSILPVLRSANPISADYLKLSNTEADGNFTANNSFDEGGNTGWTINEPTTQNTLYWVGNSGDWNTSGNWSDASGGSPQTCIPTNSTNVVFDENSFSGDNTVSLDEKAYCSSMTWTNLSHNPTFEGQGELYIGDNFSLHGNLAADFSGTLYLESNTSTYTHTVETKGTEINAEIIVRGDAHWDFIDPATINNRILFESGGLALSGNSLTAQNILSTENTTRYANIENAQVFLKGSNTVWDVNSENLTFKAAGSNLEVQNTDAGITKFKGNGLNYYDFNAAAGHIKTYGNNNFNILTINAGNTLELESGSRTQFETLNETADCSQNISLISEIADNPAVIEKTGTGDLLVDYFFIRNVSADNTGGKTYNADVSVGQGETSGWNFTNPPAGTDYYWLGNTSNWHDVNNWEFSDGTPAACLPTASDNVIVETGRFDADASKTIQIDKAAFCADFTASGLNEMLSVQLSGNLFASGNISTDNNVEINYTQTPTFESIDDYNYGLFLVPDGADVNLDVHNTSLNVNIYVNPAQTPDKVILPAGVDLISGDLNSLNILSGTFEAADPASTITCGSLKTTSDAPKTLNLQSINLNIVYNLQLQDNSLLTLNANNSTIEFNGNSAGFSEFNGSDQTFFDISIQGNTQANDNDLVFLLKGSNTFNTLKIYDGVNILAESDKIQTVTNDFTLEGTCQNYVSLKSSETGTQSFFNNDPANSSITCLVVKDIDVTADTEAFLSFDNGNNTGWIFDPEPAAQASFTLPDPACLNESLTFTNNSQSVDGGMTNLNFEWTIESTSVSSDQNLTKTFSAAGDYSISLTATHTPTGCSDEQVQTLSLEEHTAFLSSDKPSREICAGETVTFTGESDKATEFRFYVNNNFIDLGDLTQTTYTANSLQDGDSVHLETTYNGCIATSSAQTFTVNPVPTVSMSSSDADNSICENNEISFTASGAQEYKFFIDGGSTGQFSTTSTYITDQLNDQSVVTVTGKNSLGCTAQSADEYTITVHANPTVSLASDPDPAEICEGENILFTSAGAQDYEFFVNGISQGSPAADNTYETTQMLNSDIVTAVGYDSNGCNSTSNAVQVFVNETPETVLSSDAENESICLNETVEFTGSGATEYEFFIDGVSQGSFSTNNTLSTSNLSDGQTVSLVGKINECTASADPLTFTVAPVIELSASETEICAGETVTFTASGDNQYQFFIDEQAATSLSAESVFETADLEDGQLVSVEGSTGACLPEPVEMIVHALPQASLSSSEPDNTICEGDEITFSASGASEYEFFIDGNSQGPASVSSTLTKDNLSNGQTTSVLAYSNYGCSAFSPDEITVTVHPYPNVTLASSETENEICEGDEISFTASGADEYQFYISGEAQGNFTTDNIFSASNLSGNPTITALGRSNSCVSEANESYNYTVYSLPNVTLEPLSAISVCKSDTISAEAKGAVNYEFFVNSVSQGAPSTNNIFQSADLSDSDKITVTGYQNICSAPSTDTIVADINPIPDITFTSNIGTEGLCPNDTARFYATGAQEFRFYIDNLAYGNRSSDGEIKISNPEHLQEMSVIGYNNACSKPAGNTITVKVNHINLKVNTSAEGNALCSGESLTVYAEGADKYEFFLNDNSLGAAGTSAQASVNNIQKGDYINVEGTDTENGCRVMSAQYDLHITETPNVWAEPGPVFCLGDSAVLMTDYEHNYQWLLNNQEIPEAENESFAAYEGGVYSVNVSAGKQGSIYSVGANTYGQLGDGTDQQSSEKVRAIAENNFETLAAGNDFMTATDTQGNMYAWGNNEWGNLGTGNYAAQKEPIRIEAISDVKRASAGSRHVLALKTDGTLMAWGQNTYGQLGIGNHNSSNFPQAVEGLQNIVSTAAGHKHSLALNSQGKVFAWGDNSFGQLGDGSFSESTEPKAITGPDSVVDIAAGAYHSLAVDSDGKVWAWGRNESGQLGTGDYLTANSPVKLPHTYHILKAAAGNQHSLALNKQGEVFSWGANTEGQLGMVNTENTLVPKKVSVEGVKNIFGGAHNSFALRKDGTVRSWGLNNYGQLGDLSATNRSAPEKAEQFFGIESISAGEHFTGVIWGVQNTCPSEEVELTVKTVPEVTIVQDGMTLTTIEAQSYQWYFNGSPLSNTNAQSITASATGEYTVEATFENGCSAFSDVFSFTLDGQTLFAEQGAYISPNPNKGSFKLTLDMPDEILKTINYCRLVSISGQTVSEKKLKAQKQQKLSFDSLSPGVYYLNILSDKGKLTLKVFITN